VYDFETFLTPPDQDVSNSDVNTHIVDEHSVSGFCYYRVTDIPQYQVPPTVCSGSDVMTRFYEHVMSESETINKIMPEQVPMTTMTIDDRRRHRAATTCTNCDCYFIHKNYKVHHHDHVTGKYLFPACKNCNLALKPKKCPSNTYFLPVLAHNSKNFDSHFIIKHFEKRYTEQCQKKGQKVGLDEVKVIHQNGERFIQFQIGNLKFLDSFQFLTPSLDNLVSLLLKGGKQNFRHTTKFLGDSELVFSKGVYPYNYMQNRTKFAETQLPPIESFYNALNDEPLSTEDYEHAQEIWNFFAIQNVQQYHDHYLMSDVLLLADVFEHFHQNVLEKHGLDCLFYPTLPALAWSMALKHTQVELDLITDKAIYLTFENSIRGGISTISNRYARANNPLVEGYDPTKPTTFITYLDANNLYGAAQSKPLSVGNFRLLSPDEISRLDIEKISEDSPTGYVIECDLEYLIQLTCMRSTRTIPLLPNI